VILRLPLLRCNQPFLGRDYCPARKWLMPEPCHFADRQECKQIGAIEGMLPQAG